MRNCGVLTCFLAVVAWLLVGVAAAAEDVPVGKSDFVFVDERGNADKPIRVWTYRPHGLMPESPITFVMHGTLRNGETYREPWVPLADRYKTLVVVPEFSLEHYRDPSTYQFGNLRTTDGQPIDESKWTFSAIEHLFDHLKAATGNRRERYFLFGHSAGSQFVHRLALFKADARIELAVAANAGSYTVPTFDVKFPFGLGESSLTEQRLRLAFNVPLMVLLGERDIDPNDKHLPKNPEAQAQGPHRLDRGRHFFQATEAEARRLNVSLRWKLTTVPDVGHDNTKMAPIAARAMFEPQRSATPPNFLVFFVDNFGNGDLQCFHPDTPHRTPNVNRLAAEGTKFTSFYVASGVCTPSRAALMTGCYPRRVNMHVSDKNTAVLQPIAKKGLHPDEETIAEVLRRAGYATGIFGKWHLGDQPPFLPTRQGFDEFWGLPYSDDMTRDKFPDLWPDLPLMRGEKVIEAPVDRNLLVKRTTEEVIAFLERNRSRPFFAYVPHTMPGSTAHPFSSPAFRGQSKNGDYGDSVEELDWSTGEILAALKRLGLDDNTLVVWTSDNGAVQRNPPQGSSAPYRGFGYDTSEGAMRMPCVMRWPGKIPAGQVQDELCSTMDLLPTFAKLAGAPLPAKPIDGRDIAPLLFGTRGAKSHWDEKGFGYYRLEQLQAVRSGPWKLYLPLTNKFVTLNRKTAPAKLELFDVRHDVHEDHEVSAQHPDVVQRLTTLAENIRTEIGDTDNPGTGQRLAGSVDDPKPLVVAP